MAIAHYIKEIGRGKDGARPLSRAQADDLLGQILDGRCSDLEIGAFCLAMRIKGETPEEMAGFLDAVRTRTALLPGPGAPTVVLPSYNGARKLPVLTPLLALLLARDGIAVLLHGRPTEDVRVTSAAVLAELGIGPGRLEAGRVAVRDTADLCEPLARLLDVRRAVGLRNPAHSIVKLMNPVAARAVVVASYTHGEYAESMHATLQLAGADALLLRGTEGEPVADARRLPQMDGYLAGAHTPLDAKSPDGLQAVPGLPATDAAATAAYIRAVLAGAQPVPAPIARQLAHLVQLAREAHTHAEAVAA